MCVPAGGPLSKSGQVRSRLNVCTAVESVAHNRVLIAMQGNKEEPLALGVEASGRALETGHERAFADSVAQAPCTTKLGQTEPTH